MNRHFFLLVLLNMLVNSLVYVPTILIRDRYHGAFLAILLGTLVSTVLLAVFCLALKKHPRKGLPELLGRTPGWFRFIFLIGFGGMWFFAGAVTLLAVSNIAARYINPGMSGNFLISLLCLFVLITVAYLNTIKVMYVLEIILILNVPAILIVLYLAYTGEYISWYSIFEVASHVREVPGWSDLSAATYVFAGYTNMVIFQRVFPKEIKIARLWYLPLIGLAVLLTVFFIPIGFHGTDGVGDLTYPWVTTVDSLRMELAPIERVTTIALIQYISLSLVSIIVHWHVSFELLRGSVSWRPRRARTRNVSRWFVLLVFGVVIWMMEYWIHETDLMPFGETWLNLRLVSEILLVVSMLWLSRRKSA